VVPLSLKKGSAQGDNTGFLTESLLDIDLSQRENDLEFCLEMNVHRALWDRINNAGDFDTQTIRSAQIGHENTLSEAGDVSDFDFGELLLGIRSLKIWQNQAKDTSMCSPSQIGDCESDNQIRGEQPLEEATLTNLIAAKTKQNIEEHKHNDYENRGQSQLHAPSGKQTFASMVATKLAPNDQVQQDKLKNALSNLKFDVMAIHEILAAKPTRDHKSVTGENGGAKSHSATSAIVSRHLATSLGTGLTSGVTGHEGGDDDLCMWMRYELLMNKVDAALENYWHLRTMVF